jgi:outer membrane scaffolding protein for murein synthesis (MipA/OmpV family)
LLAWTGALSPALSQTLPEEEMEQPSIFSPDNWNVNLGGGVGIGPVYQGSDNYKVRPITFGSVSYRNFFLGPAGLGINFLSIKGLRAGPILGYRGGRKATADPALAGLGNISPSIEVGAFVAYPVGPFELSGTLRQAVTHSSNGAIGRVKLDYAQSLLDGDLQLHVGPQLDLGDGQYVGKWFGVTPTQSAASGLPVYDPAGGLTGIGAYLTLDYRLSADFYLHAFGNIRELIGDAADSPVVHNTDQAWTGLGLVWHWSPQ